MEGGGGSAWESEWRQMCTECIVQTLRRDELDGGCDLKGRVGELEWEGAQAGKSLGV